MFDGCSFATENRSELPSCKPPTFGSRYKDVHPDTPLPDFSLIDFDQQPMRCYASLILQNYVVSHIGYEDSKNRDDLISIASKTHQLKKNNIRTAESSNKNRILVFARSIIAIE